MGRERKRLSMFEERIYIYNRDMGVCQHCGTEVSMDDFQVAHRIAQTKSNVKKWGRSVIDHPLNKAATHGGACNDGMNIGFNPVESAALVETILNDADTP